MTFDPIDWDDDDATADACTMDCVMGPTNEPGCLYDTTKEPDGQQPADVVTAEQQQDGAVGRVEAFLTAWRYYGNDGLVSSECQPGETRKYAELTEADLRAVLAERTALAARVAEQREDVAAARRERDEAKAETAKLNAYLTLVVARYGNQTFYERDVKRAAALSAALAHDAAPEARSEPVERSETSGGIGTASNSSTGTAGLSEPEPPRDTSAWCWAPSPHTLLHCGLLRDHKPPHRRGERTWIDDTTMEDGR